MKHIICLMFLILTAVTINNEGAQATSYPSAVVWNNNIYVFSIEEVDSTQIGNEIGRIERIRTPMPFKNGEANDKPAGSLLFSITGTDPQAEIAVKVNDVYYKATVLGPVEADTSDRFIEQTWGVALFVIGFLLVVTIVFLWIQKKRRIG